MNILERLKVAITPGGWEHVNHLMIKQAINEMTRLSDLLEARQVATGLTKLELEKLHADNKQLRIDLAEQAALSKKQVVEIARLLSDNEQLKTKLRNKDYSTPSRK